MRRNLPIMLSASLVTAAFVISLGEISHPAALGWQVEKGNKECRDGGPNSCTSRDTCPKDENGDFLPGNYFCTVSQNDPVERRDNICEDVKSRSACRYIYPPCGGKLDCRTQMPLGVDCLETYYDCVEGK